MDIINRLEDDDKGKIEYFVTLLIHQSKYRVLKKEIQERRKEIQAGEIIKHNDIWNKMNVLDCLYQKRIERFSSDSSI